MRAPKFLVNILPFLLVTTCIMLTNQIAKAQSSVQIGSGNELLFLDNGQIRCLDDNHRILFRRSQNVMEFREFGNIMFSPGAETGAQTAKMYMSSNGNMGIGTTSPRGKLDIWGGSMHITGNDLNGTLVGGTGSGYAYLGCNSLTNGIMISPGGSVGIGLGTNTFNEATYRLAVNGSALFTKVVVKDYNNWPDYVFNTTYRLRPLSEVEQYINEHHHLPEVVSAEEVQKNGLDISENQAALLKKIEELTLYVIEQNKKIAALEAKMQSMEKKDK